MHTRRLVPLLAGCTLLILSTACQDEPTAPRSEPEPPSGPLGLIEITITGLDGPAPSAAAAVAPSSIDGPQPGFYVPGGAASTGAIQLEPVSTGSFTDGVRGAGGYRYVHATFRVRNAQDDGTPYNTVRQNLTFIAASGAGTLNGTAISSLERFDGSPADPAIATGILPTGLVARDGTGEIVSMGPDILQVFTEPEAADVVEPLGVTALPYGFVVRNAEDGGRRLPALPAVDQYDGVVTFAFRIPLQPSAADDPFTVSATFLAQDDLDTRITQSLEEQTPEGEAAFLARAAEIGATMKTVLPGTGSYWGTSSDTRTICSVRTAGTSASPTAYLVRRSISAVTYTDPFAGRPLWAGGANARRVYSVTAVDGVGNTVTDVPAHLSFGAGDVFAQWGRGAVRMLPRLDRDSTSVTAHACDTSSAPTTVHASGYIPLTGGSLHSVAVKGDGTVAAWGSNSYGESTVPTGLAGVVQVAAGYAHTLALKSDGTVVAWGLNNTGQTTIPAGLAGVVQVAAGSNHSLALQGDGTVVAWGYDNYGQSSVPAGLTDVVQVAAGRGYFSLALRSDGTVVAWGIDNQGETDIPAGLSDVVQLAAGSNHALALRSDGTVVAWGRAFEGQTAVPAGLSDVVQVAAGDYHSLALKGDGTVVAWGYNLHGQTNVPAGLTDVVHIAAGDNHSMALRSDGTLVVWGDNGSGQITVPAGLVTAVP